jgi:hypothetical protein
MDTHGGGRIDGLHRVDHGAEAEHGRIQVERDPLLRGGDNTLGILILFLRTDRIARHKLNVSMTIPPPIHRDAGHW